MKAIAGLSIAAALALPVCVAADTADKQLASLKGQVSYQHGVAKRPLALNASIVLADKDYAMTGADSRGAVTLPDSSVVTVGSETKIQMAFFNQTDIANAKFILYDGKARFEVRHPQGSKANYTFSTPTASIAVRGTQGDIGVAKDSLQVNVYEVCDQTMPVVVTTKSGEQFTVPAGKAFVGKLVNGIMRAQVETLTDQMINNLGGDLGNIPLTGAQAIARVKSEAGNAADNVIPGASGAVEALGGLFGHKNKATPTPSASPASATCS
ncbi:MAG: FecR family protein [Candidatus Eremiobacteraeota bacterium]|nr:FecR family protein [Candidatus Eremiobacteraeota bacterium]